VTPVPDAGDGFGVVSLLSDFGSRDIFVGVMKGAVLRRAPHVTLVDLTHEVPPQDVRTGALHLARAVPYLPIAVHLAVVDPGVGTERAAVAVATERGDVLVGPDNGLLTLAAEALGGVAAVHELSAVEHRAAEVSDTFHGRDVFAPAAAAVANGVAVSELGPVRHQLTQVTVPTASVSAGQLTTEVLTIDRFGNLQLGATVADASRAGLTLGERLIVGLGSGERIEVPFVRTFGEVADRSPAVLGDSDGHLAIVITGGDAAARTGARVGTPARLSRT
jgi:S-adenosylmethionine hydrolase